MAYRSRANLLRGRGTSRPPADNNDITDTSSTMLSSSIHGRGLGRPARRPDTTDTSTVDIPALALRGRKPMHIGCLARQSALVSETNRPDIEGIVM
jgi:hypothetical protein